MIESIDDNVSLVVARETMRQAEDARRGSHSGLRETMRRPLLLASPGWTMPWLGELELSDFHVSV